MIEFYATPLENMVHSSERDSFSSENSIEELFEHGLLEKGATDMATGEKTLTLKQFEVRYTPRLLRIANQVKNSTIYHKYLQLPDASKNNEELILALKRVRFECQCKLAVDAYGLSTQIFGKGRQGC